MFSNVPAVLDDRYRQLFRIRRSPETWTCGCGQAHRYEPGRADDAATLTVTCPDCHRTATLRAAARP